MSYRWPQNIPQVVARRSVLVAARWIWQLRPPREDQWILFLIGKVLSALTALRNGRDGCMAYFLRYALKSAGQASQAWLGVFKISCCAKELLSRSAVESRSGKERVSTCNFRGKVYH